MGEIKMGIIKTLFASTCCLFASVLVGQQNRPTASNKLFEIKLSNTSIYYKSIGKGKPLIFLHGFSADHQMMEASMEPIFKNSNGYRRIYIDFPGMGQSPASESIKNVDDMLVVINEFIDSLIPNQHFLLAGQSFGGYIARGILKTKQEWVDGVCLIAPLVNPNKRAVPEKKVIVSNKALLDTITNATAKGAFSQVAVVQEPAIYERTKTEIIDPISLANQKFLLRFTGKNYEFSFNPDSLSKPFDKPSLILAGRQDHITGYYDNWKYFQNYTRTSFVILDRAGHNLHIEQSELFTSLVKEWLRRV
ncbi:MAG TPA: alpha/beta hydrolase [Chitinophagaceae bacterium]|nr:alpha/beta hydrolase [Chitinophagaceae bacterium]HNU16077.1 alpha/beta hydrolase [Chitinophagaceae bacterium]